MPEPLSPRERALDEAFHGEVRARATSLRGLMGNLRLARRYELVPLDPDNVVDDAGGMVPDCDRCQDTCCTGAENRITLRLSDLARLIDAGLEWAIDVDKQTPPEVHERFPDLAAREQLDSNRTLPALKQRDDGRCVFLEEDGRCRVHPIRPLRCRRFPYRLAPDKRRVTYAARCQSRRPATEAERRAFVDDVVRNYNEKLKDVLFLEHGRPALARLGLVRYLPVVE